MKILIAGGGTGGHVYPAVSIAKEFTDHGTDVIMIGRKGSFEEKIYRSNNLPFRSIHSTTLDLSLPKILSFGYHVSRGVSDAFKIINSEKPDAVLGAGGYVSAPMLLASYLKGVKYFIYEQNIIPGRTNRLFGKSAKAIFTGFPDVYRFFDPEKTIFVGNPVRPEIFSVSKTEGVSFFHFSSDKPVLLVFGGSGGARKLNFTFAKIAKNIMSKMNGQIIFITGKRDFDDVKAMLGDLPEGFVLLKYLNEMEYALKASDFALVRGGAMTLSELVRSKLPALVIPFPYARDNHQFKNALFLKEKGCVGLLEEKDLSEQLLFDKIFYYFNHINIMKEKMDKCAKIFPANSAGLIYEAIMEKLNG